MPNIYVIAGCNGAGKTTASYSILPKMLECKEFVNADEIARGISPFQPEKVVIEAGRIMLKRMRDLITQKIDFAFETTLSSKSYVKYILDAQTKGYSVSLIFFWLNSPNLAIERVKIRAASGGHDIHEDIIRRRYWSGIKNLSQLYLPICDDWLIIDNSTPPLQVVAQKYKDNLIIHKYQIYRKLTEI